MFSEYYLQEISKLPIVHSTFALGTILVVNLQHHHYRNMNHIYKGPNDKDSISHSTTTNQDEDVDEDVDEYLDEDVDVLVSTIIERLRTNHHILARRYNRYSIGYVVSPSFTPKECDTITQLLFSTIRDVSDERTERENEKRKENEKEREKVKEIEYLKEIYNQSLKKKKKKNR